MVFTIVTVIFLSTGFMATFFATNIFEFTYIKDGTRLHLGFVPKYMFSIGLAVSVPLIAMDYTFCNIQGWLTSLWALFVRGARSSTAL